MKQTPLLEFRSSAFPVVPGEDAETNPGIYGMALAQWLAEQLSAAGFRTRPVIAEDFGWCVPIESAPHSLYVVCASTEEGEGHWRVFAFAEGGIMARLLGKDRSTQSLSTLFAALKQCLASAPAIHDLREERDV